MLIAFYIAGGVAVAATILMLLQLNAVHALLCLVVSLLALAIVFYTLGAPFAAVLEGIVYAGAIMVLFIFVMMLLNLGRAAVRTEKLWQPRGAWIGPVILALVLDGEFVYLLDRGAPAGHAPPPIGPIPVGISLFTTYLTGVELVSMLLLGAIVAAYRLGWRRRERAAPEAELECVEEVWGVPQ
ncbi:MAG TPA: NADH-quinone oxidoreductase subunit J [Bryobacteraceae bacterium]|nr:NADH-quinone oxidoreductase subunit J [Bryobacteraceae bacterium]